MLAGWVEWIYDHLPSKTELAIGLGLFVVLAALSVLLTGWIVVRVPKNYFVGPHPPPLWDGGHPVARVLAKVVKNLVGVAFIVLGIIFLFTPGQGLLTLLLGLMLLDLPGKRKLEQWLVSRPGVLSCINRLRARYGRPPLLTDPVSPRPEGALPGSAPSGRGETGVNN